VRTRPVYFAGFDDDLRLPGWRVQRVVSDYYFVYRLTKVRTRPESEHRPE